MSIKSLQLFVDRSILFLLSICVGVMPLIYFPYDKFSLVPYRVDVIFKPKQIFLIVVEIILLLLFVVYFKINKKLYKINNIFILLGGFYITLVFSTIFSNYWKIAVFGRPFRHEGLIAYSTYIVLFLMIYIFADNTKKIKILLYTLLSSAAIISIYGLLQYYNIDPIYKDPFIITGVYANRAFSTLGNPVFASSYIAMLFSLSFILYFFSKGKQFYIFGCCTVLFFAFLLATSSKSGIIGAFFSISIFISFYIKKAVIYKKKLSYLFIILIGISIFIEFTGKPITPFKRISSFYSNITIKKDIKTVNKLQTKKSGSVVFKKDFSRMHIYKTSFKLLKKNPLLGSGLDTFNKVFPQKKNMRLLDKAHNEYFQLGITIGIPGLLLYLMFLLSIIKNNFHNYKSFNPYQLALFFAILAYWIQAIFNISVVSVAPIYWGLMGLNLAVLKIEKLKN